MNTEPTKTAMEKMIEWYEANFSEVDFENPRILHKMQDLREEEKQSTSPIQAEIVRLKEIINKNMQQ